MRVEECGIDLERLSKLSDGLVVAVGVVQGCAEVRVNNWRQWIQLNRALPFGNSFLESSEGCQSVVTEPVMCCRVVRLELDRAFVFAHGAGQIDFAKEEHFAECEGRFGQIGIKAESF